MLLTLLSTTSPFSNKSKKELDNSEQEVSSLYNQNQQTDYICSSTALQHVQGLETPLQQKEEGKPTLFLLPTWPICHHYGEGTPRLPSLLCS